MDKQFSQPVGKIIATGIVFLVLLLVAVPKQFKSRRDAKRKTAIRYILSFQRAAVRYQNDSFNVRFFINTEEAIREGFPYEENRDGYNYTYITDKSRLHFGFLAVPDVENSDDRAYMGDESGMIFTCKITAKMKEKFEPDELPEIIDFKKPSQKRIKAGDWLPL